MTGEPLNQRPADALAHAVPEVEGPNSMPTGSRFDTSTESYATGWPNTPTITESAKRARSVVIANCLGTAVNGVQEALSVLRTREQAMLDFFDELGMSPDEGTFDEPPEVARGLVEMWTRIPTQGEIEGLFDFPEGPDTVRAVA